MGTKRALASTRPQGRLRAPKTQSSVLERESHWRGRRLGKEDLGMRWEWMRGSVRPGWGSVL
jgi:hypothetical protein